MIEKERSARSAAEQSAAVVAARLEAMTDRATKADAEKTAKLFAQASSELNTARVQVQAQQTALDSVARECDMLKDQAKESRISAKKSGELAAELRGQLAATKANPAKPTHPANE